MGDARLGDAAAILAGDFGSGMAQEALLSVDVAPARVLEAARVFARIQEDVVRGQLLDVVGSLDPVRTPGGACDERSESSDGDVNAQVEMKHDLKTVSYTVRGPLAMGAALAGASPARVDALDRFARPLGVAFQLRDDLLGVFGDGAATGKPVGSDLREGKRTALVAAAMEDREASRLLPRVLGVSDAPDEEVHALVRRIEASGAKGRVEARIDALVAEARVALDGAPFDEGARDVLSGAAAALGDRGA
jgi:geranylgeranyl diphosphate synthase type I